MRKLLLIVITLITFTNVSYASFPVTENVQTSDVEPSTINYQDPLRKVVKTSLIIGIIGIILMILQYVIDPHEYYKGYLLSGYLLLFTALTYLVYKEIKKRWLKILCFILLFFLIGVTAPLIN